MTNKLRYFIGNWKMFGDFKSLKIVNKINQFSRLSKKKLKYKIILCVPNTLIHFFNKKIKSKSISLGAQNCHYHQGLGSFTGNVNASMLKKAGAKYIILGHSENRAEGENNLLIRKKIQSVYDENLNIIFCIGETLKEKKQGKTYSILKKQIKDSLKKNINIKNILFAYEPVWSIGTNKIPAMNELKRIVIFIKKEVQKFLKTKKSPKLLYGGSVNDENISLFSSISDLDGFLVGGASRSPKKFIDIIKNYYK